jgi:hypothetical protein
LVLINHINAHPGDTTVPTPPPTSQLSPPIYYDVNGDGLLTPIDLLQVVARINATFGVSGEKEPDAGNQDIRAEQTIDNASISGDIIEQTQWGNTPSTPGTQDLAVDVQGTNPNAGSPGRSIVGHSGQNEFARRYSNPLEDDMDSPFLELDGVLSDIAQNVADVWQYSPILEPRDALTIAAHDIRK